METTDAKKIVDECAQQREQPERAMTVQEAIDEALWVERTPDGFLHPERSRTIIRTLHAALQASPCYYKGVRESIPTFTLLAYDPAGHAAIRRWADLAQTHGARPAKYESAIAMVRDWELRTDLRWPT
jgi:hypothetical protein